MKSIITADRSDIQKRDYLTFILLIPSSLEIITI